MTLAALAILAPLGIALLAAVGWRRTLRRLDEEKRRSGRYLSLIESLARLPGVVGTGGGDPGLDLETARRGDLSARDVPNRLQGEGRSRAETGGLEPGSDPRYLFVSFEEEIRRARRQERPLTVVALDLGGSGEPSQGGGRALEDRMLRRVAHLLRGQMRGCDTCIRYAGDQFILILPGISRDEATKMEGRLRLALRGIPETQHTGSSPRFQPQFGTATFPDDGETFEQLLALASSRRVQDASPGSVRGPRRQGLILFPTPDKTFHRN